MLKPILNSFINPAIKPIVSGIRKCFALTLNNTHGVFLNRAIDPDGDIDIEWYQLGLDNSSNTPVSIITQCLSSIVTSREFVLRWQALGGPLNLTVGGQELIIPLNILNAEGLWRITYLGNIINVFKDGLLIGSRDRLRGTAREPSAPTVFAARNDAGAMVEFANGLIPWIRVNNFYYSMSTINSNVQQSLPFGNFITIINAGDWVQIPCNLRP